MKTNILDQLAIGMAVICGIHCLMMPIILALLPLIAASFFAHEHFHLWMLLFVLPTTGISIFMGCRKHKDKWTATRA
ncbi:MAG: MerC domain-containing protein [Pontiella sp.]